VTDKQIARALTALNDVSIRQLEVAGERLMERRGAWERFGRVFIDIANEREGGLQSELLSPGGEDGGTPAVG